MCINTTRLCIQRHHMGIRNMKIIKSCLSFHSISRRLNPVRSWTNSVHVDFHGLSAARSGPAGADIGMTSSCLYLLSSHPSGMIINYTWQQAAWYISYCNLLGLTVLSPLGCSQVTWPALVQGEEGLGYQSVTHLSEWLVVWSLAFRWSKSRSRATLTKPLMLFVLVQQLWVEHLSID